MERHPFSARSHRTRVLSTLIAVLVAAAISLGLGTPVTGGGWAVGSLDATPEARAGHTEDVGFTILQHGVTPRHFDDEAASDVGIEIVGADGDITFFPASRSKQVGHYVATVAFPAAGEYSWSIRMGWFAPQELGSLTVTDDARESGAGVWATARWGLVAGAGLLAAIALGDVLTGRGRTRRATA